ncbi:Rossmann-like and DUF2520 domain-containing protein [Aquimarina litoralis]|uniref:Rossmann-like and DUF2520 domain-containing protein n=1 Tax=Aquimarina litoralis TaxID=584605 RepID=UPI001C5862ED|nr:DUF2520 domain-containing protein [Aquimarina litoralis]MBW1296653.1 DUF2520 domain-containing protein [Aquimarina litoralis]
MITIVLLGAGNVAKHLYEAFLPLNLVKVIQCYNRKGVQIHENQEGVFVTNNLNDLKEADVYILAISDDAVVEVSNKLPFQNRLVVHTSGSVPMKSMNSKNTRGVFYPLQTFSATKKVDFTTIPFCIEAEQEKHSALLETLASQLTKKIYAISSDQRNTLHVAAVFINNFTNHLFSIGSDICKEHNIPFEILHPLILETAKKAIEMNPDNAQTGPAIRNDVQTINRHLKILKDDSQKQLYNLLSQAIQTKYGKKL